MILQLSPSIPIETPKGSAQSWFLIDYSPEHDLFWICALDDTGEIWMFANHEVRAQKNITLGRTLKIIDKINKCVTCNGTGVIIECECCHGKGVI